MSELYNFENHARQILPVLTKNLDEAYAKSTGPLQHPEIVFSCYSDLLTGIKMVYSVSMALFEVSLDRHA